MDTERRAAFPQITNLRTVLFEALGLFAALAEPAAAQVTQRVDLGPQGAQGDSYNGTSSISADGRYVAFDALASNLVPGDTNGTSDVFVRDRGLGITERVSVSSAGAEGDSQSLAASISADGRYVAFESYASNLVAGDANGTSDVFVRDRLLGVTERVSVDSAGAGGNNSSLHASISADGRFVVFSSIATNLVTGDTNGLGDVFVRDRSLGTTERVSVDSAGAQGSGESGEGSISADGRFVAFESDAANLVGADTNAVRDIFVRDRQLGTTERVSVGAAGSQANDFSFVPSISADGRYVAFQSFASNLVAGDTNAREDVFVRDRQRGLTERASLDASGAQGTRTSYGAAISADGRKVAFHSDSPNLVPDDTNGKWDVFVRDLELGLTLRASETSAGIQGNGDSDSPALSADGRFVSFESFATNLVFGDTNGLGDVFVHEFLGGPSFTSACAPGTGGVVACPCGNPPSGTGRGCDNSAGSGGALLAASGGTYLSSDSLLLQTSGEKPTALSVVMQGGALVPAGVLAGQGVSCVGGSLVRLYTKSASSGGITVPSLESGEVPVSVRSALLGDPIQAGQSRAYVVLYRDPIVLGGCPSSSTFNATQTGVVTWSP